MKHLPIFILTAVTLPVTAQNAVVEESVVDVVCDSRTHAIQNFKEVTTILNEHGADLATFVCSCSKNDKLTAFKGQVTDSSGRVIRKIKESELKQTEYSPYLAIDDYKVYYDYTPPVYPVTITYEWAIDSHDNLIEFPSFCPQTDYDVSVKRASYTLTAPKELAVRHALQNIDKTVNVSENSNGSQILSLELSDLPALKYEPYSRPLRERLPMAYFAPTDFTYYGTQGSMKDWTEYGKWEYSLINGSEILPDAVCHELHQLTDDLKTDREKIEALYQRLEKTTRYVAILLGIGGQKPASAADVCKSGFGDCKGLSNYMRAMLKEVGIPSNYITISTSNRRLLKDFASVGQMNHVILQVPLQGDTLWLECTNPQLPMGYVHEDIAGHNAIEVSKAGGRLVQLPVYADSANLMHSKISIQLDSKGAADVSLLQDSHNWQYENNIPLMKMDEKDRHKTLQRMIRVPQAEIGRMDVKEDGATITVDAEVRSQRYATVTGQRLFVPICPIHNGYSTPPTLPNRQEDIYLKAGYLDRDEITLTIPEGYDIEARPNDISIEHPFGRFSFTIRSEGNEIHIQNSLLMKSGTYDKSLYPQFIEFIKTVSSIYSQKVVLKNNL
ncbi:MAG: DUF3858 domain-containing protein [Prevotella sp.]|nr:DUF3858 domain-containing protein [Prevotella sp.]